MYFRLRRISFGRSALRNTLTGAWVFVVTISTGYATPATIQENPFRFELTPIASYRVGGSFSEKDGPGRAELNESEAAGLAFNILANPNGQYELLYTRQNTEAETSGLLTSDPAIDMDIESFHFGGTYLFDGERARPFIALTLGMTRFDPGLSDASSENFFSASFGGGIQLRPRSRLGIRLEARVFTTFVDSDSAIFCGSDNGAGFCLVQLDAKTVSQWEARAGLVFRF